MSLLFIADRALCFHHHHRSRAGIEREDVDAAPVAEVVEAHLYPGEPAPLAQQSDAPVDEFGVCGVEQPIERFATPPNRQVSRCVKRLEHARDRPNSHGAQLVALDARDHLARDARASGQVGLPPPPPTSELTDCASHVRPDHPTRIVRWTYRGLIGGLPAEPAYDPNRMTYEELLDLARRLEGRRLETVTGKGFTVGIALNCPFFTPESSGYGQSDGRKAAERFVERYNATGSLRPGDYADVTRNASYFIGMLMAAND